VAIHKLPRFHAKTPFATCWLSFFKLSAVRAIKQFSAEYPHLVHDGPMKSLHFLNIPHIISQSKIKNQKSKIKNQKSNQQHVNVAF
jgi:hypothetical protein